MKLLYHAKDTHSSYVSRKSYFGHLAGQNFNSRRRSKNLNTGNRPILASFLSANNRKISFGSFMVPKSFFDMVGSKISSNVTISCDNVPWKAKINQNENMEEWRADQYIIDCLTLEYHKYCALWKFNVYTEFGKYFNIKIRKMDIDQNARFLILDTEFESLYKNWKDGNKLTISLLERTWEIVVIWKYGRCMFGSGWYEFAVDTNLEDGDTLVLSKLHRSMPDKLKACVFKLHIDCFDEDKENKEWRRSFYKVMTEDCLIGGVLVVPKQIKEYYARNLIHMRKFQVNGESWFICYNYIGGYGRIYQEDGLEIDYVSRSTYESSEAISNCFWDFDCDMVSEEMQLMVIDNIEDETAAVGIEVAAHDNLAENVEINEDVMNDEILEFSVALKVSHVNHSSHGVHIPSHVSARNRDWQSGEEVMLRTDVGTWMVRIVFNNGSPRFSAGWNKFARDNKFIVNQKLVFTLIEEDDVIVFDIQSV
ncbi:hypothetical protein POM88_030076 [Heracleum sosnowskyi]|uniref:TF-B3 domain-containing protein n=1 Tax=Heracleum sosnowskyi TaxID=360622 RepID=A0AAD8HVU2_9APIA|nr:hypothetical protein POM88_030076 [Heracleum sosnowskyi]